MMRLMELNGDEYKEPKKHNYHFCVAYNEEMLLDYRKSILVCRKCGLWKEMYIRKIR